MKRKRALPVRIEFRNCDISHTDYLIFHRKEFLVLNFFWSHSCMSNLWWKVLLTHTFIGLNHSTNLRFWVPEIFISGFWSQICCQKSYNREMFGSLHLIFPNAEVLLFFFYKLWRNTLDYRWVSKILTNSVIRTLIWAALWHLMNDADKSVKLISKN